jgi:membrane protein involved in colicin uptake
MAFSHIAAAANGNPFFVPHWQNASAYCQVVANILLQAEKELAEKELAEKAEAEKAEAEKAEAEKAEAEKAAAEDSEGEPTFEPVDEPMTQG